MEIAMSLGSPSFVSPRESSAGLLDTRTAVDAQTTERRRTAIQRASVSPPM